MSSLPLWAVEILWQGCISAPELKGGDWGGEQVPRPDHTFPPQTLDGDLPGARLWSKPLGHFTKLVPKSSHKYLLAKV